MKYTDETKDVVTVDTSFIPRGHRLWIELEIDKAEQRGDIEPFQSEDSPVAPEVD